MFLLPSMTHSCLCLVCVCVWITNESKLLYTSHIVVVEIVAKEFSACRECNLSLYHGYALVLVCVCACLCHSDLDSTSSPVHTFNVFFFASEFSSFTVCVCMWKCSCLEPTITKQNILLNCKRISAHVWVVCFYYMICMV